MNISAMRATQERSERKKPDFSTIENHCFEILCFFSPKTAFYLSDLSNIVATSLSLATCKRERFERCRRDRNDAQKWVKGISLTCWPDASSVLWRRSRPGLFGFRVPLVRRIGSESRIRALFGRRHRSSAPTGCTAANSDTLVDRSSLRSLGPLSEYQNSTM